MNILKIIYIAAKIRKPYSPAVISVNSILPLPVIYCSISTANTKTVKIVVVNMNEIADILHFAKYLKIKSDRIKINKPRAPISQKCRSLSLNPKPKACERPSIRS
jgi:hypothetical protein